MSNLIRLKTRDVPRAPHEMPVRDARCAPRNPTRRERHAMPEGGSSLTRAADGDLTDGRQMPVASLPPGMYVFEADDNGVRIFRLDGDASTSAPARDGAGTGWTIEKIQRANDAFYAKRGA